jgi:hypothetical protein
MQAIMQNSSPQSRLVQPRALPYATRAKKTRGSGMGDEPSFQPYLDAVIKSGDRTRNVWYILVLVLIAVFIGEWNTRPGSVSTTRFVRMIDALVCVNDKNWNPKQYGPLCQEALEYAKIRHHFPQALTDSDGPNKEAKTELTKELEKRVEDLMRRELDTHVVTVPILGVSIDGNDLWLVSSFVIIFMLRILRACLNREFDNLRRAAIRATDHVKRELLIMSQLFALPADRRHPQFFLLFLPIALYAFELFNTYLTIEVGDILQGPLDNKLQFISQNLLLLPICYFCWRCFLAARAIEKLLRQMESP